MSALDVLRSFSESRMEDDHAIDNGVTYGHAREIVQQIADLQVKIAELREELARVTEAQHAAVIGWDAEREVVERLRREMEGQ